MRTRTLLLIFLLVDVLILLFSIGLISLFHYDFNLEHWPILPILKLSGVMLVSWFITYLFFIDDMKFLKRSLWNLFKNQMQKIVTFLSISALTVLFLNLDATSRTIFFGSSILFFVFKIILSVGLFYFFRIKNEKNMSPIIVIGNNKIGKQIYKYFKKNTYLGYQPVGIIDDVDHVSVNGVAVGKLEDMQKIYDETPFNDAIISLPLTEDKVINRMIHVSEKMGVRPRIVPYYYGGMHRNFKVQLIGEVPTLTLREVPLDNYPNRFWKRAFDLFFTILGVIFLIPFFCIIAIVIKMESKGPVFYRPIRLGVNNRPFSLYKFRSMVNSDAENGGTQSTTKNDPRITKFGAFLRKFNLDELPQLINVLNNDMSLVGPRPHRVYLNRQLQEKMNHYMARHYIKPGITGWAQVNGWRGPTETKLQYMGRTLHDLWYIENWTFPLDIYIVMLTFFGKKARKNAF